MNIAIINRNAGKACGFACIFLFDRKYMPAIKFKTRVFVCDIMSVSERRMAITIEHEVLIVM